MLAVTGMAGAMTLVSTQLAGAAPSVVTQTFGYTGSTTTFTVPDGITSITLTVTGGEGGNGGADATPAPAPGGYRGVVTGTMTVTPGQVLTIAVGSGGATGASRVGAGGASAAVGGSNPLGGYAGGVGGKAGVNGSSGFGGAGGAASVVQVGGANIVAGGGGGNGGSGQFASTQGRQATSAYAGRTDVVSTSGQTGINASDACTATSCSNSDGGGSGGGGGGAQGGAQGAIEFGAGTSNEWFGYGGSVGRNDTASLGGLSASYQYYSDNGTNGQSGSVVIAYSVGSPASPTALSGTAGNGSVSLVWTAPSDTGQSAISDYLVEYSSDGGSTWSSPIDLGSTATAATVSGLANGTGYVFRVAAVNSVGIGSYSAASATITPLGPPAAPTISGVTAQDGALSLALVAPTTGAPVTGYDYRLDGGDWFGVASASTTLVIPGLVNGTSYTVEVRAESAVGAGDASAPATGTPEAVPGAPTISSLSAEPGAISVAFTPGFGGGSSITGYEYSLGGGAWTAASGTSSPLSITGLADGVTYSVRLRAVNGVGAGTASAAASVTTPDVPGAPDVTAVTPGDGSVTIVFTPGATGGSPIESYQYRTSAGGTWTTATSVSSPITLTGLANGAALAVSLRAVNAVGAGAASAPVGVTPATVPSAPTIIGSTVASGSGELSTSFTAPSSDGGAAITTYQYSTDGGATWHDRTDGGDTASPVVVTVLSSDGTTPLTGGATYPIELRAVNSAGAGTASATAAGLAVTVPLAPVIDAVSALPGALRTTFSAASNGGSPITGYSYSVDGGSTWTSTGTLGTTFTITGLTNGTGYPVKVRAENAVGAGAASGAVSGTPVDLPGRASIASVVRGDRTLRATVSLADDGGSPVTAWQYSTDAGATWATASGTTSPLVITTLSSGGATPLENGTAYALQVRAVTAVGTGPASATTNVAPAAAPAAPSIALTAGDGSIAIAFALGTDGGSPITGLDYSVDGGASWVAAGTLSSPLTVSGLANGTAYTVRLRADNAIGTGTPSAASSATPRTVPGAPTGIVATPDSSSADVSWIAPASDGGAPVTGYTASAYATGTGGTAIASCTTTGTTSCSIPGLTNGTAYYVAVVASNAAGAGAASAPRAVVTPLQRPGAPTIGSVTAGDGTLSVAFTAGSAGASPITGYQVSLDGGVTWAAASGTTSPILLSGLTNGTAYSVRLRAVSAAGVGTASNAVSGTPVGYPGAPDPTTIVANGGNGRITVSWAAADLNGGTLQSYTATAFTALTSGSTAGTCTTSTLSCTITGLSNGTTYYVSLQTLNTAGMYSVRSAPRVPATPNTTPGAPTGVVATAGDAQATVTWTAPTSTGASALTGYTVLCSAAGGAYTSCGTVAADATSAVIPLTNGVSYTFEVKATNSNGTGPASAASAAVVPLAPGVVPSFSTPARTTDGFTASITNFDSGATYTVSTGSGSVVRSGADLTVTGLAAGASAEVTVTVVKSGSATVSGSVTGSALAAGVAPVITDVTATTDGLTFVIANYDPSLDYHASASPAGVVVIDAAGHGTVTGESGGTTVTVTVTATDPGVSTASASADATVLLLGVAPTLSASTPLAGGYRFTIEDYDPSTTYSFDESHGGAVDQVGAIVTVSGLAPGVSSETTVTAVSPGHAAASSTVSGTSFPSGTAPQTGAVTRTVDGFSFGFTAVPGTVYSVTSDAGVVTLDGTTVTVTGLAPGATTTVHLTASAAGTLDSATDVTGTAIAVGVAARLAAPASRTGGFTVVIEDYSAELTYLLTSSAGTATRSGAVITVSGLGSGAQATVTVTVRRDGYTDASSSVTGTALTPSSAPTTAATPVPTETPTAAPSPTPGWASASGSGSATSTASGPSESAPGDGAATVGGRSTPVTLSRSGSAVTLAAQGGVRLTVTAFDAAGAAPLGADGAIELPRGGHLEAALSGLEPGSSFTISLLGVTTPLASGTASADGTGSATVQVPASVAAGPHTLVVTVMRADGSTMTMQLGYRLLDAQDVSATSPLWAGWWVLPLVVLLLLVAVAWWVIAARRRRREEED